MNFKRILAGWSQCARSGFELKKNASHAGLSFWVHSSARMCILLRELKQHFRRKPMYQKKAALSRKRNPGIAPGRGPVYTAACRKVQRKIRGKTRRAETENGSTESLGLGRREITRTSSRKVKNNEKNQASEWFDSTGSHFSLRSGKSARTKPERLAQEVGAVDRLSGSYCHQCQDCHYGCPVDAGAGHGCAAAPDHCLGN